MRSLRTAVVLTLTAAAAAVVPAGTALAASPLGQLPTRGVTDALLTQAVTGALPVGPVTDALPTQSVLGALHTGTASGIGPVKHLTLDPLSNSGVDPLDNAVGSQVADFKPLSTAAVTGPVTHGGTLATLPLVGKVTSLLPG